MQDAELVNRIDALAHEEQALRLAAGADGLATAARAREEAIRRELEVLYDLRDRRRASASAGGDPDGVQPLDADTVEGYLQ